MAKRNVPSPVVIILLKLSLFASFLIGFDALVFKLSGGTLSLLANLWIPLIG